jgi:hypothetical protein
MKQSAISGSLKWMCLTLMFSSAMAIPAKSQIVFEQAYPYSGTITQLEIDGPKFYLMDVPGEQCRMYNMDFSLFKTINLDVPTDRYLYDIQFVTQSLFDSDSEIELLYVFYQYVVTPTSYYYIYTTRIVNENGTILLDLPGCSWTDIRKIEGSGSRMMNYITDYSVYPYPVETRIYRIPGEVMGSGSVEAEENAGKVFPNPTTGPVQLPAGSFSNPDKAWWVILDSAGNLIARVPVSDPYRQVDLKQMGLAAGIYMLRLESKNYQTKFQQVVLSN